MLKLLIIILYFVGMVAIGVVSRAKAKGADNFFVAGRKGTTSFITGSLVATIVGGSATVGMAGLGFKQGLTGAWWLLVGSVGLLVLGFFLAKKVREFALYTLPELVEKLYDRRVALVASVLIVVAWLGIIAGQILAAGKIMGVLGIGRPLWWMLVFTAVFVLYTVLGGQHANIRTDIVQAAIIFVGIFGGLGFLLSNLGGFTGLKASLSPEKFAFPLSSGFGGYELVSLLLLVGLTYVVGPDMYSRLFCAKDTKVARASAFWTALIIIPFAFGIVLMGAGASVLFPQISPEQAFPKMVTEAFPTLLGGLVLAGLLSAVMSSADSCLLSAGTILTVDIIQRFKPSSNQERTVFLSRWVIVILGVASLILALALKGVISALLFAYTVYTGGLVLPVIAGFYRNRLRVTSWGALVAIIGGGLAALISKVLGIKYLDLGSLPISVALLFITSFIETAGWKKKRG
ncbi:sodium:solute symporter [Chloroflexota bacterium]